MTILPGNLQETSKGLSDSTPQRSDTDWQGPGNRFNRFPARPQLAGNSVRTLIDDLLAEQQTLSAVDRFSRLHQDTAGSTRQKSYSDLIPLTEPKAGEQYAFVVDLEKCSGCKACVTACHSLNGLDEGETWRNVGLLVGAWNHAAPNVPTLHASRLPGRSRAEAGSTSPPPPPPPFHQHVTTACHHCIDPACLNGCPVLAYDKDPLTGIVRHLDDQCMGCSYCVMKCPYEVPVYSRQRGIVRKCDMCANRLEAGEPPACAQACPSEAIRIEIVTRQSVAARKSFLPDSPDPQITLPTTRYLLRDSTPGTIVAADSGALRLENPHWPLIIMLLFTQASAGMLLSAVLACLSPWGIDPRPLELTSAVTLLVGLAVSVLHLGQPLKAWRAFLGWRTSWLSREIIGFNLFAAASVLAISRPTVAPLSVGAILGLAAVAASAMVYVDTRRPFWSARFVFPNFFGSTLLLGATVASVVFSWMNSASPATRGAGLSALIIRTALILWRSRGLNNAVHDPDSPVHLNARVIATTFPWTARSQTWLFLFSTAFGSLALVDSLGFGPWWASLGALTTLASELIARYLFFVASASKRMPGEICP